MSENMCFDNIKDAVIYVAEDFSKYIDNSISGKKIAIIYDSDPDGICSGVILHKLLDLKGADVVTNMSLDKNIPLFSKKFNDEIVSLDIDLIIMTDISIKGFAYYDGFSKFREDFPSIDFIIFDHHEDNSDYGSNYYNINNLQTTLSGSQFCCSKFVYEVCRLIDPNISKYDWVKAIGIIGDTNHITWGKDIIKVIVKDNSKLSKKGSVEEFKLPSEFDEFFATRYGKASNLIFYGLSKPSNEVNKIYSWVYSSKDIGELLSHLNIYSDIGFEIDDYVENFDYFMKFSKDVNDLQVFELEVKSKNSIHSILSNILSYRDHDLIIFIYQREGAYIYVSLRQQIGKFDLSKLAKLANVFDSSNGGGHKVAAGARIKKDEFYNFKELFYSELGKLEGKND